MRCIRTRVACVLMALALAMPAWAAGPQPAHSANGGRTTDEADRPKDAKQAPPPAASAPVVQGDDPDLDVNLAQPDFMLSSLPTTLRLPRNRMTFRLTHRFNQPLDESGLDDLFGMDSGAIIGLEFRSGLIPGGQLGFYRTSDRTIELFSQYDVVRQGGKRPLGIAAFGSVEGTDNFTDTYSPAIGAVISREIGTRAAVYAQPFWVHNTNPEPSDLVDDDSTAMIGLGVRLRLFSSTYLVAEAAPRMSGYAPGTTHVSLAIEQRAGGHLFQITFANNQGTTPANVARGGPGGSNWYLGFNLARKFY